jgi:DNA-binding transcriptional regulator YhcF (GntR family)
MTNSAINKTPYVRLRFEAVRSETASIGQQIISAVKRELDAGRLPAGSRLPPVRVLSHQLGISKNTAQAAYAELAARGLLENRNRQGYFVSAPETPRSRQNYPPAAALSFYKPTAAMVDSNHSGEKMLDIGSVFIDPELLPHARIAWSCRAASISRGSRRACASKEFCWMCARSRGSSANRICTVQKSVMRAYPSRRCGRLWSVLPAKFDAPCDGPTSRPPCMREQGPGSAIAATADRASVLRSSCP